MKFTVSIFGREIVRVDITRDCETSFLVPDFIPPELQTIPEDLPVVDFDYDRDFETPLDTD
jgi:hypothetical protein